MTEAISRHENQAKQSLKIILERRSFKVIIGTLALTSLILLLAPTVIVVITSFTSAFSLKFPPPGYSTKWYLALFNDSPEIIAAFEVSIKVAVIATLGSVLLAVAAAMALAKRQEKWAKIAEAVFLSPLMLPTLALGLALLMLFNLTGHGLSFWTLVIGHIAITSPYIIRTTTASLSQIDRGLLESARSLGASGWFTFWTVTLPLIMPGILAGSFIAFMYSFDNVAISLFLSDARSEVLPIRMWHNIESNLDVRAAAVSGLLIGVTLILMVVMEKLVRISKHVR